MSAPDFLSGLLRPVSLPENTPFEPVGLALGKGSCGLWAGGMNSSLEAMRGWAAPSASAWASRSH